jgi:hypothetical protein
MVISLNPGSHFTDLGAEASQPQVVVNDPSFLKSSGQLQTSISEVLEQTATLILNFLPAVISWMEKSALFLLDRWGYPSSKVETVPCSL